MLTRRSTPFPRADGASTTAMRDGVPWTELSGYISTDLLRAATVRYVALGGGPIWAANCDKASNHSRDAISVARSQLQYAHLARGLTVMVVSAPNTVIRMAALSLRMSLGAASGVRLIVVDTEDDIPGEIERQTALIERAMRKGTR